MEKIKDRIIYLNTYQIIKQKICVCVLSGESIISNKFIINQAQIQF